VFGLLIGSFLNVVIYRVPRGESIAYPGSHCGSCGAPVKAYDNIPLLSYVLLRGQCRACKAGISWVYPAVELMTGLLFVAVAFKSGATLRALFEMAFVAVIVTLVFIDARHKLLPNVITYPSLLVTLVAVAVLGWVESANNASAFARYWSDEPSSMWTAISISALILAFAVPVYWGIDRLDNVLFGKYFEWDESEEQANATDAEILQQRRHDRVVNITMIAGVIGGIAWVAVSLLSGSDALTKLKIFAAYEALLSAILGAFVGGGLIWLLRALYFYTRGFEGMGLGDVKMMGFIGAFLGWRSAILVLIGGSILGSVVGVILARRSKQGLKTALPFGIFLGISAILALFFGEPIIDWYFGMLK
ncbi:MAG TPA: prepilin peptidase, partial [Blastocatellia bacterium]|nr:prepilin peptidase [Blastocatellia bacterium]